MKNVYRKSALDKIQSVDQLDKVLKITSPMSWLALLGVTAILAAALVWSIVGTLPSTVTAAGVIVNADTSTNTILAKQHGTVQEVIGAGQKVYMNTPVLRLEDGTSSVLQNSDQVGFISDVLVRQGDIVSNGTEILRIRPEMTDNQQHAVVCYVPVSDADKIQRGMEAHITLTAADSSVYGYMTGRVINVDAWATSTNGISAVVGSDNSMVNALNNNGNGVCAVTCELETDPNTVSGYNWSNEKGKGKDVTAPQMCSVRIITENVPPISKLFAKLKDIWENKEK